MFDESWGKLRSARCMWMRGGTSKGAYFLKNDLPSNIVERDRFLLAMMGSPDRHQIDGMGGANPLTSKVAIIEKSDRDGVDVNYLFLQVMVDKAVISDAQNCGNILAGVGPFAIERGLVIAQDDETLVNIYMENTGQIAVEKIITKNGEVNYFGQTKIDGVPNTASPIVLSFKDSAGSACGALLPTGNEVDIVDGVAVTCIDNGMPVVVLLASDVGVNGTESCETLEQNKTLRHILENIRLKAGVLMNLGDVTHKTVPKISLVSPAKLGGAISTRTFIPHTCHSSIGVLGAVSVASACILENSPANNIANIPPDKVKRLSIEHPSGEMSVVLEIDDNGHIDNAAILRTARKLFDGVVFA